MIFNGIQRIWRCVLEVHTVNLFLGSSRMLIYLSTFKNILSCKTHKKNIYDFVSGSDEGNKGFGFYDTISLSIWDLEDYYRGRLMRFKEP